MNYLFLINSGFFVYNFCSELVAKIINNSIQIYRFCSVKPAWYIMDNGQFVDSSIISIFDKSSAWLYEDSLLIKDSSLKSKKLPYLSFEFKFSDTTTNMDDFIEKTKFQAVSEPPLPVLMAAFCIDQKILYPWSNSNFTAFTKTGDQIEFTGSSGLIPKE